jgi:thiamine-phosphate pyrophosphorylase
VTLCLVTDRRRLCADATPIDVARRCLVEQARLAVAAGIDLIQVRELDLDTGVLAALVTDLVRLAHGTGTRIVVNDRLDVALACGAAGVHLRGDSMPAEAVRQIAPPGFLIGRSVHRLDEALAAGPLDYLIAGTVFPTSSKSSGRAGPPGPAADRLLGLAGLGRIAQAVGVPVLAIGGMTVERAGAVRAAGAAGLAAIGMFVDPAREAPCRAMPLDEVVEALRRKFDSVERAS